MRTKLLRITALMSPLLLVFVLLQTGCPTPPPPDGVPSETKEDAGGTDTTKTDETKDETKPPETREEAKTDADGGPGDQGKPDVDPGDTPKPDSDCPTGCKTCEPTGPAAKLKLGATCTPAEAGQTEPCDTGLKCLETRVLNGRFYRPINLCLKLCSGDGDCDSSNGETCANPNPGVGQDNACGQYKKTGEACDSTQYAFCGQPANQTVHCLVKDINNDNTGICTLNCAQDPNACDTASGQVCRKPLPDAVTSYCLDPVLPGPKCLGEKCDVSSNTTNCLSGLTCTEGFCVQECTKSTEDQDCDTAAGDTCFVPFGASKGLCQPKPTVTKEGEECTPLKRCDESLNLACVASGDKTVCVKKCNTNDGEKNNKACSSDQLCQKPSDAIAFGICRNPAKFDEKCGLTSVCTDVPSACITVDSTLGASCLRLCDPKKNVSEDDASNPDCDGGKGRCLQLNGAITSGGNSFEGACAPARPKTVEVGGSCNLTEKDGGLRSPDCKDGAVCVNFGPPTGSVCLSTCDQCKQTKKGADWVSAECGDDKPCLSLTNGQGICLPDGKPIREVGEYCDNFSNGCKDPDNVVCVRFSNEEDAQSVCSKRCNPSNGTTSNPDCPNQGQCGGLTGGGGVCIPLAKRSRKLGETCNGPIGSPRFDACLEKDGGNDLICAEPNIPGLVGTCQVSCNATKGFKDNADCKAKGLNNHLCLPSDLTQPQKGACVELCSFSNRKDCSQQQCKYGQCREMILGTRGDCTDATKEKECTDKGGACVNKTCLATVCL